MLKEVIKIPNGNMTVNYIIYQCDKCGARLEEAWPMVEENDGQQHYCGECAFKLGKITDKEYIKHFLYFIGLKGLRAAINPETGEVETTLNKRFPWEGKNKDHRHSKMYVQWREKVFIRDNYTCQRCNVRGGNLEAHHIRPFSMYGGLRYKIDNGVTLCKKCHKEVHRSKDNEWIHTD